MEKIHNNLTIENLIKTEHFKQLDRYKKQEIVIDSEWFKQFNYSQQREIKAGLENNLDISWYAKDYFNDGKMGVIKVGLMKGLDVSLYAKKEFNWLQMLEIYDGSKQKRFI